MAQNEVKSKIKIMREHLSQFMTYIPEFSKLDSKFKDSEMYLNVRIKDLEEEYKKVKTMHSEIISLAQEDDESFIAYTENNVFHGIQSIYFKFSTNLHDFLKIVTQSAHNSTFTDSTQAAFQRINFNPTANNNSPQNSPSFVSDVSVPHWLINITPFEGSYNKWPEFKDAFESYVHDNPQMTDLCKLRFLQYLLKGDALKVIKREFGSFKSAEYVDVWDKLKHRYNHTRSLVFSYFNMLFNQPSVEKETSESLKALYDTTFDSLLALKGMGFNIEHWGPMLLYLIHSKLPSRTRTLWDERLGTSDAVPKYTKLLDFIETRFRVLEGCEMSQRSSTTTITKSTEKPKKSATLQTTQKPVPQSKSKFKCKVCDKGSHAIKTCFKFQRLSPIERETVAQSSGHCINCLSFSHQIAECTSNGRCAKCGDKHHSMLHKEEVINQNSSTTGNQGTRSTSDGRFNRTIETCLSEIDRNVVFPTALVRVSNSAGQSLILRAIIDACSDSSFITERVIRKLTLPLTSTLVEASGVGNVATVCSKSLTSCRIQSLILPSFSLSIRAYVLKKISSDRPIESFALREGFNTDLDLADPTFNSSGRIDMLLGGDVDAAIQMEGFQRLDRENIIFKESKLGWLVSGSLESVQCFNSSFIKISEDSSTSLDSTLRSFWEVENVPHERLMSESESLCERIYNETTTLSTEGKYVVCLPFKHEFKGFKEMRTIAMNRFCQLEKRLQRNPQLCEEYSKCLEEYMYLGHMDEVDPKNFKDAYYIPHHCIIKSSSTTTKLRVVFDASAVDVNMNSLNAQLLNGPRLQIDLLDHLIKFRVFKYAFTADIEKMYRQIWVIPDDYKYQLILWRPTPASEIKTYALKTVTFGTASAPYLAIKTLQRLASDKVREWPLGSRCVKSSFYVDDFIYGSDTIESGLQIQSETIEILKSAGFKLRKWSTNDSLLLANIPESDRECSPLLLFGSESSVKTLGIFWNTIDDSFSFKIKLEQHEVHTKRNVLSNISKIFDPLGWLSPFVVLTKMFMQQLWKVGIDWDQALSPELNESWLNIVSGIVACEQIKIPRWIGAVSNQSELELHGFADASSTAYGAVIYIKSILASQINVNILISKTKVAPLKEMTIPRLELSSALLLAQLMAHVRHVLNISGQNCFYWSDSMIALAWIKDDPTKRSTFVANRVVEIQSLTEIPHWSHVASPENPADLASRGVSPDTLASSHIWWNGPSFLHKISNPKSNCVYNEQTPPEEDKKIRPAAKKSIVQTFLTQRNSSIAEVSSNIIKFSSNDFLNKYSTLSKLCRVIAYCRRFVTRHRPNHLHIDPTEFDDALVVVLRIVQEESYSEEMSSLKNKNPISKQSSLYNLNPFLCKDDLIRSNSRLCNADHLNFDQKFPILLPRRHILSHLIVRQAHLSTSHGTQQQTCMMIGQRYHIPRLTSLVRFIINKCVICFRFRCHGLQQQMAALPSPRVTPSRPFLHSGVDFAGPFELKKWRGKCNSFYKSYIALFICLSTKAVHMELVIDLSSAAFIAAYRRFIARRGIARHIYSDCGTNFVGAKRFITRSMRDVENKWSDEVQRELATFQTNWHFNPPGSPHFGGLWEAGVKSAKYHLKRIIGNSRFTYDELETFILQTESCMNSRPLCRISGDPDVEVITPAHFLIQDSLLALPDDNLEDKKIVPSDRWNYLQKLFQQFWDVWNRDYLNTIRQRQKWRGVRTNVKTGDVVLLLENTIPANTWIMALVIDVHPGDDGLVRVVTLKTKNNSFKRPITKICPLPLEPQHED